MGADIVDLGEVRRSRAPAPPPPQTTTAEAIGMATLVYLGAIAFLAFNLGETK